MKGKRKKNHPVLKTLFILLLIAAALAAVMIWRQRSSGAGSSREDQMLVPKESTAVVTRQDIRQTTEGSGILEAGSEVTDVSSWSVTISHVEAEVGDSISAGDLIADIDLSSIDAQISRLEGSLQEVNRSISSVSKSGSSSLSAPVSGRVRRIFVEEDDMLSDVMNQYGGIMEIAAAGQLKVDFTPLSDTFIGMEVTVRFENDDEDYKAEGLILEMEDGTATAVFDDDSDYDVDLEASVYDKADRLLGTGMVLSRHPYLVEASYGRADDIRVSEGEWVDNGSTLLTRTEVAYNADYLSLLSDREEIMEDLQEMRRLKEDPVIRAEEDGIISSLLLSDRTPVAEDASMYTLMRTDQYKLQTQIDELDIDGVEAGQTAVVVFDAFEDREYTGRVSKVSSLGQNVNGVTTYTVTIDLDGKKEFKSAMSATATITTQEEKDVLTVPVDAIQTKDEQKVVTVLSGNDLSVSEDRVVTLGLINNTTAQITEGLEEGETVLVIGTTQLEEMLNLMRGSRRSSRGGEGS